MQKEEKIAAVLKIKSFEDPGCILLTTKKGVVKKTKIDAYSNPRKKGVNAINIDEGDEVISAHLVNDNQQIMLFTRNGMAVRFEESLVRPIGRVSRGVRGVMLKDPNDFVVSSCVVNGDETILVVCENGFGKRSKVEHFRKTNRGGVGVRSILTSVRNGFVVGALNVKNEDGVFIMTLSGQTIRISMEGVRVMSRSTQGVKLVNLKASDKLVVIQKIEAVKEVVKEIVKEIGKEIVDEKE